MRIRSLVLSCLLLFGALQAHAQDPQTNRGIDAAGVFHVNDIDNVNLFNGNLIIGIPLAAQFPLNGGFSYSIHLIYTGQPWDFPQTNGNEPPDVFKALPVPNRRSNAGMGWRVSMGALISPSDPSNPTCPDNIPGTCVNWLYESPDGGDHYFWPKDGIYYTRDGSYLRMTDHTTYLEVEFPDGVVHRFNTDGTLSAIYTPFDRAVSGVPAPSVTITYPTNTSTNNVCSDADATSCWKISDTLGRTQYVTFQDTTRLATGKLAQKIVVTAPGGNHATYALHYNYDAANMAYDPARDIDLMLDAGGCYTRWTDPSHRLIPILTSIGLPDNSQYAFEIYNDPTPGCKQGSMKTLTLPTLGSIGYDYGKYFHNGLPRVRSPYVPGIVQRTKTTATGDAASWTYSPVDRNPADTLCAGCQFNQHYNRERVLTVTDPDGHKSRHYFSIAESDQINDSTDPDGWTATEMGLPFTRTPTLSTTDPSTSPAQTRYLSSEVLDDTGAVERATYVKYDENLGAGDDTAEFRREAASLTKYGAPDSGRWSSTVRSEFDGFGHYRKTVTDGNFAAEGSADLDKHTQFVDYNPGIAATDNPDPSTWPGSSWVLNTFDYQWSQVARVNPNDSAELATHTKKTEFCFEPATGFLARTRALESDAADVSGVSQGDSDLITLFGRVSSTGDITGNLFSQKSYGGDTAYGGTAVTLPAGSLCAINLSSYTAHYEVRNTAYQHGVRATSQYYSNAAGALMTFKTLDRTIDLSGAVSSENDVAGVTTTYTPDTANDPLHIKTVSTPGTADINYTYSNASSSGSSFTPAEITVTQSDSEGTVKTRVQYDSFGRVWREFRIMHDNTEVTRETLYDSSNRKLSQSMWDPSSYTSKTTYQYDFLGRLVSVQPPDGQTVTTSYAGDSAHTTSSNVMMSTSSTASQTATDTTEHMDRYGRLWYLTEPNGTATAYGYSATGGLARVCMNATLTSGALSTASCTQGSTQAQERRFQYDNRGFLMSETHPESGTIAYTYDALGHVLTKRPATTGTIFDLNYSYDDAERLLQIDARNPNQTSAFRPSKVFTFASANAGSNLKLGKLETAIRHNYRPVAGASDMDVRVTETYTYGSSSGGRLTDRTTEIKDMSNSGVNQVITQTQSYSALGLVNSITYPYCASGVQCGTPNSGSVSLTHANGWLTSVFAPNAGNYATDIGYHASGMVSTVTHGNNPAVIDTQTSDPNGMPRPLSITFGSFGSCVAPTIGNTLDSVTIASGGNKTWTVSASGSGTLVYQWHKDGANTGTSSPSFDTGALTTSPHDYYVRVANSCGSLQSNTARVTIAGPPSITAQPQNVTFSAPSVRLTVTANGNPAPDYHWYQGTSGTTGNPVGSNQPYYDTPNLSVTTQYWVHVSNTGGFADSNTATVTVPLATPVNLNAYMLTTTSVQVNWVGSTNAQHYEIWRRENAGALHWAGESTTTGFTDNPVIANTTYVYQVCASPSAGSPCTSAFSNQDLATTVAFSNLAVGSTVRLAYFSELLTMVNAVVKAAYAGSAGNPKSWTDILQGSPPPPAPAVGGIVYGEYVLALRRTMDAALSALLGVAPQPYTDMNLPGSPQVVIKAIHITELRGRAQ